MSSRFEHVAEFLGDTLRHSAPFRVWLRAHRWCGETVGMHSELSVQDFALLSESGTEVLTLCLALSKEDSSSVLLHLPLSVATARLDPGAFEGSRGPERFFIMEAERRDSYARFLADGFRKGQRLRTSTGGELHFRGESLGSFRSLEPSVEGDSSNLLVRMATSDHEVLFKSYKVLDPQNREPLILERLHRRRFAHVPRFFGELSLGQGEERIVVGVATEKLEAEDLFAWFTGQWRTTLDGGALPPVDLEAVTPAIAQALGDATAALHEALVDRKPGPFQAEPFTPEDAQAAYRAATRNLADSARLLAHLGAGEGGISPELASESRTLLLDQRKGIEGVLDFLQASIGTVKCVTHADLHLAQVLRSHEGALFFLDFEGEPERPPGQRSVKLPPLRDVATMIRSFAYVRHTAWRDRLGGIPDAPLKALHPQSLTAGEREVLQRLAIWEDGAVRHFSQSYLRRSTLYPEFDRETAQRVLLGWTMEKALYELRYELKHRPWNFLIPLEGVLSLASAR